MTSEVVDPISPEVQAQLSLSPEAQAQVRFSAMWQDAWKQARAELGNPNLYRTAELVYYWLSYQEPEWAAPTKEAFIEQAVDAARDPEIFKNALYPEAPYAVRRLSQEGPLLIFSAGDTDGSVNREGKLVPGSREQEHRIIASEVLAQPGLEHATGIAAAEDKFERLFFKGLVIWLIENGATEFGVIEDKPGNLKQGAELLRDTLRELRQTHEHLLRDIDIDLPPVLAWVRQGSHGDTTEEAAEGVTDLPHISQIDWFLDQYSRMRGGRKGKIGWLLDYDGVLSEDLKRQYYQPRAILERLKERGLLDNTSYETAS